MNLSHLLFFFFFLLLLVSQVKSTDDKIEETCKTCASKSTIFDYNFCMSSLNNSPVSPPPHPPLLPTDLSFLALTPMLQALDNATATASTIQQLMSEGGGFEDDVYGRACLADCLELYEDAAERLEEAVRVFVSREEKETVKVMVSAAMEAATTCETGFMERDGGDGGGAMTWKSPIGGENYKLFELGEIALCIINMMSPVTSMSL